LERALVGLDFFALVEAGLRGRLALPFERVRELDRFAEPLLLELEDPADEPLGLVAFLRVVLAVCAISVSFARFAQSRLGLTGGPLSGAWSSALMNSVTRASYDAVPGRNPANCVKLRCRRSS
jgi:hypothetical protein